MRQRVMIAMGLINDPKLLIADEPTTALDVTVQAQILELIARLQHELDTAIVLITHDLGVVAEVADEIAVMYAGKIVERGPRDPIFADPQHPYTWGLLGSIPRLDQPREAELVPIPGRPPSLINRPPGCAFHPRCPYVQEKHKVIVPPLEPVAGDPRHSVACLLPDAAAARAVERAARRREARGGARRGGRRERGPAGRDRRQGGGMSATRSALVEARDVEMHFPLKSRRDPPARRRRRQGGRRRQLRRLRGRDARPRRRVGLRQVDDGARAHAAARADRRQRHASRARTSRT